MSTTAQQYQPEDMSNNQAWDIYAQSVSAWSYAKRAADAMSELAVGHALALAPLMNVQDEPNILQAMDRAHANTCQRVVHLRSVEKQAKQVMRDIGTATYSQRYAGGGPGARVGG